MILLSTVRPVLSVFPNTHSMRLPDFLIIGAMKAGTTSLAADLEALPQVFLPSVKEPHFLCKPHVLTNRGQEEYSALFRRAQSAQVCGEASTGYTKLPRVRGVPERARQLAGKELKLIYIVRDPIARAISHHYHLARGGLASPDFDLALRDNSDLVDFGRYAMQLRPWLDAFPRTRLHIVVFEEYVRDTAAVIASVAEFLGVPNGSPAAVTGGPKNQGESVLVARAGLQRLVASVTWSHWYKLYVHPRLPRAVSRLAKSIVMRPAPPRPPPPSSEALRLLVDRFQEDAEELRLILGRPAPIWNLEAAWCTPTPDRDSHPARHS